MKSDDIKNSEFMQFLSSSEMTPPRGISETIAAHVHKDLFPSFERVFLKVLGVHAVVSLLSLSICSQFGVQTVPVTDLMNQFMQVVGHKYCMAVCGALYLGLSALALTYFLNPEDIRAIRRHRVLQFALLAGVSMGVFLCLGATVLFLPFVLWFIGSVVSGILALELGWKIRLLLAQSAQI